MDRIDPPIEEPIYTKSKIEERARATFEKMRRNYRVIPNAPYYKPFDPLMKDATPKNPINSATFGLQESLNGVDDFKAPQTNTCRFCF